MKPPRCQICGKDFRRNRNGGKLVSFQLTEKQKLRKKEMQEKRMVGHPPGRVWFCNEHLELAQKYSHLDSSTALQKMKEELEGGSSIFQKMKNYFGSFLK